MSARNGARARPLSTATGAAIDDADMFLSRMEEKMGMLKLIVRKQQAAIEELQADNTRLRTERDALAHAQHTSSTEIARLCKEAADSAERVAELGGGDILLNSKPKHVVMDAREISSLASSTDSSAALSDGLKDEEQSSSCQEDTVTVLSSAKRSSEKRKQREPGSPQPQGRTVHRGKAAETFVIRPGSDSLSRVLDNENGDPQKIQLPRDTNRPFGSNLALAPSGPAKSSATPGQLAPARMHVRSPAGTMYIVLDSSRTAAKYAYSYLKSKALG
jgi:hypothetical protein